MIYNRTAQDVEEAITIRDTKVKEFETLTSAEIDTLERGMLTIGALNRIENKQAELKILLNAAGYWNRDIVNLTWTNADWLYLEDWQRVLDNLNVLRKGIFAYGDTPQTPNQNINFENLNAVEKILYDVENVIDDMQSMYRECGTFMCGE